MLAGERVSALIAVVSKQRGARGAGALLAAQHVYGLVQGRAGETSGAQAPVWRERLWVIMVMTRRR